MTTEIHTPDDELEALMLQLEQETGVVVPKTPAPTPTATAAPVSMSDDDALLASLDPTPSAAAVATVALAADDQSELLASLEAGLSNEQKIAALTPASKEAMLAALEQPAPVAAQITQAQVDSSLAALGQPGLGTGAASVSPEDELALLEAELASAPAGETPVGRPVVGVREIPIVTATSDGADERGASVMPGVGTLEEAPVKQPETITAPLQPSSNGLNFFTDPEKFTVTTAISDNDLDRCMIEQNGLRAFHGVAAAKAEQQAARIKVKFEVVEATLYEEHRRLAAENGEKITEKALEGRVKTDQRWIKAKLLLVDAAAISDINRALVESLKDRKDMLVQLGADRRDEMKGQARVMAGVGAAADMRERATAGLEALQTK